MGETIQYGNKIFLKMSKNISEIEKKMPKYENKNKSKDCRNKKKISLMSSIDIVYSLLMV